MRQPSFPAGAPLAAVIPISRPATGQLSVPQATPAQPPAPRLLDRVRGVLRTGHYSPRTEESYVAWIRRFILFHGRRHPDELGEPEITSFLSALATERHVSASTQNQALAAILFLYQRVLNREIAWLTDVVHAKRPERLPVVLSRGEIAAVLSKRRFRIPSVRLAEKAGRQRNRASNG